MNTNYCYYQRTRDDEARASEVRDGKRDGGAHWRIRLSRVLRKGERRSARSFRKGHASDTAE